MTNSQDAMREALDSLLAFIIREGRSMSDLVERPRAMPSSLNDVCRTMEEAAAQPGER